MNNFIHQKTLFSEIECKVVARPTQRKAPIQVSFSNFTKYVQNCSFHDLLRLKTQQGRINGKKKTCFLRSKWRQPGWSLNTKKKHGSHCLHEVYIEPGTMSKRSIQSTATTCNFATSTQAGKSASNSLNSKHSSRHLFSDSMTVTRGLPN